MDSSISTALSELESLERCTKRLRDRCEGAKRDPREIPRESFILPASSLSPRPSLLVPLPSSLSSRPSPLVPLPSSLSPASLTLTQAGVGQVWTLGARQVWLLRRYMFLREKKERKKKKKNR